MNFSKKNLAKAAGDIQPFACKTCKGSCMGGCGGGCDGTCYDGCKGGCKTTCVGKSTKIS